MIELIVSAIIVVVSVVVIGICGLVLYGILTMNDDMEGY